MDYFRHENVKVRHQEFIPEPTSSVVDNPATQYESKILDNNIKFIAGDIDSLTKDSNSVLIGQNLAYSLNLFTSHDSTHTPSSCYSGGAVLWIRKTNT